MTDIIIVGSGAGGSSVAQELSKNPENNIIIIEAGPKIKDKDAAKCYDKWNHKAMETLKTTCTGGTSTVIAGNMVPTLVTELMFLDIDINPYLRDLENDLDIQPLPKSHTGKSTQLLIDSANNLGLKMGRMPKAINSKYCKCCGNCVLGCPYGAKWSSNKDLNLARVNDAELITEEPVIDLIVENNVIKGVKTDKNVYTADIVILAAGALETPRLLQKIGIKAGESLFVDPFITIGGLIKDVNQDSEVSMNAFLDMGDLIISPHCSGILEGKLKKLGFEAKSSDILSMMVKIPDEDKGYVHGDKIHKGITSNDVSTMSRGAGIASAILIEAGVDPKTIVSTQARGAHPGGTAKIGEIVDKNLMTKVENLYVSDASVLPKAPGKPPIMTIIALGRRLGDYLNNK